MFRLIIKAAVRVETMWVLVDGLHYHMAWKLKHLLLRVGTLNRCVLDRVVSDVCVQKRWFLKCLLQEKAVAWGCAVERMVSGSGKEGFAFIKADDAVEARPFQNMPVAERAEARRTYWKAHWGEVDGASEWPCLDLLESLARQQAQELKPISTAQVVETLRYTANKKGGPDGCTFRFLKLLPREAYSGLVYFCI